MAQEGNGEYGVDTTNDVGGFNSFLLEGYKKKGIPVPQSLIDSAQREISQNIAENEIWLSKKWQNNGNRGYSISENEKHEKSGYLKVDKRLGESVSILIDELNMISGEPNQVAKKWSDLINKTIEIHKYPKEEVNYVSGEFMDIQEKYLVNEALLPILIKLESTFELKSKEEQSNLLNELSALAVQSFRPGFDYNSFTENIVGSMIRFGKTDSFEKVVETFKKLDEEVDEFNNERIGADRIWANIINYSFNSEEGLKIIKESGKEIDPSALEQLKDLTNAKKVTITDGVAEEDDSLGEVNRIEEYELDRDDLNWGESSLRPIHYEICDTVASIPLEEHEKKNAAIFLGKTMGIRTFGCLSYYTNTFEKLGLQVAVPVLLENLRSEDVMTRRMSAEILYSLELKHLKVSTEGIQYFNKVYRLVDDEDPFFWENYYKELLRKSESEVENGEFEIRDWVRLLDGENKVGIFGDKGLVGYFKLKLEGGTENIDVNVWQLATKDFFLEKVDDKPEDRLLREVMFQSLLEEYPNVRDDVEERTGLKLHSLKLHEQGWLVAYWTDKKTTEEQKERVVRIASKYGEVGIKAFLTLDYGESADGLIEFMESETLREEEKKTVLKNYALLLNRSYEWRNFFSETEEGTGLNFAAEIHEAIIRKSSEYLQAAIIIGSGESTDVTISELIESMKQVTFTLEKLKGLYSENSSLKLVQTQYHEGYLDKENEDSKDPHASETWNFEDTKDGSTVSVTVRLVQVYDGNGEKFERRVNFKVKNKKLGMEGRIGIDMDTFPMKAGVTDRELLSLDIATGKTDFKNGIHGTVETSRILKDVAGGEGGHSYASFSKESAESYGEIASSFRDYMIKRFGWIDSWKEKGQKARLEKAKLAESLPNSDVRLL